MPDDQPDNAEDQQRFSLHLPGLLQVLAEHLYSSRTVTIRELIQNAHDSCTRRALEHKEPGYRPRIDIETDPDAGTITIRDNGGGLSRQDIQDYLTTIGRSYTRNLGEKLSLFQPEEAESLIGQFGLGFLSSFLIASEVTLTTRALGSDAEGLQWYATGDETYHVEAHPVERAGTQVMLKLKPGLEFLLDDAQIEGVVQGYADLLPIAIHINGANAAVNLRAAPWEVSNADAAMRDFIGRTFNHERPLAVLPLHDHEIDLGHDSILIPMQGFLFIPNRSIASVREYGTLRVYIRRMFICNSDRDLLPTWARFVSGVIDCAFLQPTASREDVHHDENYQQVQQALEAQLSAFLSRAAREDPTLWKAIVHAHTDVIMSWAVSDDRFFDQIADTLVLRTSRGDLTTREYLDQTDGTFYYVTRATGSLQEQLLGEGNSLPVIDAKWLAVQPFLHKYAKERGDLGLVRMDGGAQRLLRRTDEQPFESLLSHFRDREIHVRVAAYKPEAVPALLLYPPDVDTVHNAREALDSGDLPDPLAGLVGDFLSRAEREPETDDDVHIDGTLYLNANNHLLRALAQREPSTERDAALDLIYQMARLFAGQALGIPKIEQAFRDSTLSLQALIDSKKD
jgi:molecular chaperone HtpG